MVKKTSNPKLLLQSSFQPTLLDAPLRSRRRVKNKQIYFEPLAKPLQPSPYVPPKPVPPPRRKKPVALPRSREARVPTSSVQKLIEEITPLYRQEAIRKEAQKEAFKNELASKIKKKLKEEFKKELAEKLGKKIQIKIKERQNGLKGVVQSFELENISTRDPRMLFSTSQNSLIKKLAQLLERKGPFKAYFTLRVELKKRFLLDGGEAYEFAQSYFNSTATTILNELEIRGFYDSAVEEILNQIARWISKGSGWVIERILNLYFNVVSYKPLKGRSNFLLPEELRNSCKGLINLKNTDNRCFLWCHVHHLNPLQKDPQRVTLKDKEIAKTLNYSGVTFPVTIRDMDKIEKQNKININAYVYNEDGKEVSPIQNSKESYEDTLNVLLIERQRKNINSIMFISKISIVLIIILLNHITKKRFCLRCMQPFYSEYHLEAHKKDCIIVNGTQKIVMPEEGSRVQFHNYQNGLPVPFIVYADFEAITRKIDTCSPPRGKSYTQAYQKHEPCGFSYKVVCYYDKKYSTPEVLFRGENVVQKFYQNLSEEIKYCQKIITERAKRRLVMTASAEEDFQKAKKCWICQRQYKPEEGENIPVRDHCHMTGKYCGSAHKKCNFRLQISAEKIKIPVLFHNLKGYDGHLIIEGMGDIIKEKDLRGEEPLNIDVIASNPEKYITFKIGKQLKFIDSYQFMASPLANLAKALPDNKYIYTSEAFGGEKLALMKEKGVYPYDYMDSFQKFAETQLPKRDDFYSLLTNEDISEGEYEHVQKVWGTFKIKNMGQYHDLYLKSDVLLLADIFENFQEIYLNTYGLNPAHYVSLPSSSWDAMQKMTGV